MTTTRQEEQQVTHIITVTECPTEPCAVYYTDTLSQSLLVICKNKKHVDLDPLDRDIDIDIEKRIKAGVSQRQRQQDGQRHNPKFQSGAISYDF